MIAKIFLSILLATMVLLLCSCSKKVIVVIENASGVGCVLSLGGRSYGINDRSVVELMYLRGDFILSDNAGGCFTYECPVIPDDFIERQLFNNRVRLFIDKNMIIYIMRPGAKVFLEIDKQPLGFPIKPKS